MEEKIIAIIIIFVVLFFAGATTVIYYGSRIKEWIGIFKKAMAEVEAEEASTVHEEKIKEPLNLVWAKRNLTVPMILLAVFIIAYFTVLSLFKAKQIEVLVILVVLMLVVLVLESLGVSKKEPRVRFWVRLAVTIFFEVVFVCVVNLFVSGYYAATGYSVKSIVSAIAITFFFLAKAYQTQQDWYALLDEKK